MASSYDPNTYAIARAIKGEAAREPLEGQIAVGHVLLNRANASGKSPLQEWNAKGQFESHARYASDPLNKPSDQKFIDLARKIQNGTYQDPTGGATHFLNKTLQSSLGRKQPEWSFGGDGQKIGNHTFFQRNYGGKRGAETDFNDLLSYHGVTGEKANPAQSGGDLNDLLSYHGIKPGTQPQAQTQAAQKPIAGKPAQSALSAEAQKYLKSTNQADVNAFDVAKNVFGLTPYMAGGGAELSENVANLFGKGKGSEYAKKLGAEVRAQRQAQFDKFAKEHPAQNFGASVLNAFLAGPQSGTANVGRSFLGRLASSIGAGAGFGAAQSGGESLSRGKSAPEVAKGALSGGVVGGATGGALHLGAESLGASAKGLYRLFNPEKTANKAALEKIAGVITPEALKAAPAGLTTAEAMGNKGIDMVRSAVKGGADIGHEVAEDIGARLVDSPNRVRETVSKITGYNPKFAKDIAIADVDNIKNGPAAELYQKALIGKPVWSSQLEKLNKVPQIKKAIEDEIMYAELNGKTAKGLTENGILAPTDEVLHNAKKQIGANFDATNQHTQDVARNLYGHMESALKDVIPYYKEASEQGARYLGMRKHFEKGVKHFLDPSEETAKEFAERWAKLTPEMQQAERQGYLHALSNKMGEGNFSPKAFLRNEGHKTRIGTYLGEGAENFYNVIENERKMQMSGRKMVSAANVASPGSGHGENYQNLALGLSGEKGGPLSALAFGGVANALEGVQNALGKKMVHEQSNALSQYLTQSPEATAAKLADYLKAQKPPINIGGPTGVLGASAYNFLNRPIEQPQPQEQGQ